MATKIIDAVKQAELEAQKAEEKAALECDNILQNARSQAKKDADAMLQKAKEEAKARLDEARRQGDEIEREVQSKITSQIESMRQKALSRQDEAVQLILSELI